MNKLLDVVQTLNNMNAIKRTGPNLFGGINNDAIESLAEHSYRVTYLSLLFGNITENVNIERLLKYVITHDWSETIIGDFPTSSPSFNSYFDKSFRDIIKKSDGYSKSALFADANLQVDDLNKEELYVFKFCDILAQTLELIDLKQNGYRRDWIDKMYKVQVDRLKSFLHLQYAHEVILGLDEIYQRGYMSNKYLTKSTEQVWSKDRVDI